jgi:hypothetical protein
MKRRLAVTLLSAVAGLSGTVVVGTITANAAIPPVCVHHTVGQVQVEVGYCPNG